MLIWIAKYWKPLALLALIVAAGVAWRIDRAGQYRAGEVAATAKLNKLASFGLCIGVVSTSLIPII